MAKKTILALELRTSVVRAAVVARARSGFSVLECVEVERPGTSDYDESTSLRREDVFAITKQLTRRPRNAVLVSASSINLAMDQTKFRNLKPTQVQEALRWEAEPFSGVPAQESMIGYERLDLGGGASRGKGDFALGSSSQMELQVTVFPLGEFQDDKRLMAAQGLRLQRIYAEEACFPVAAQLDRKSVV